MSTKTELLARIDDLSAQLSVANYRAAGLLRNWNQSLPALSQSSIF